MPRRPREHVLEAYSRYLLHSIFTEQGWVSWDLSPDYGEDIFVRIFLSEKATPYAFFIQAKCTDNLSDHYVHHDKFLEYKIKLDHLKHWEKFWEPVVLVLCDKNTGIIYWEIIQDYLKEKNLSELEQDRLTVHIPATNILNEEGIRRIALRTRYRFKKFKLEREAALVLKDVLEEELDVKVEYEPEKETIELLYPDGSIKLISFGKFADEIKEMALVLNISEEEVPKKAIEFEKKLNELVQKDPKNLRIAIGDENGNIIEPPMTLEEMQQKADLKYEIDAYNDMKKEYEQ